MRGEGEIMYMVHSSIGGVLKIKNKMSKKIKKNPTKRISRISRAVLQKIKGKIIVKCPNCATRFLRKSATQETCMVCESPQTFIAC